MNTKRLKRIGNEPIQPQIGKNNTKRNHKSFFFYFHLRNHMVTTAFDDTRDTCRAEKYQIQQGIYRMPGTKIDLGQFWGVGLEESFLYVIKHGWPLRRASFICLIYTRMEEWIGSHYVQETKNILQKKGINQCFPKHLSPGTSKKINFYIMLKAWGRGCRKKPPPQPPHGSRFSSTV